MLTPCAYLTSYSPRGLTDLKSGISHLEGGFTLRCLQRLSLPDVATQPYAAYDVIIRPIITEQSMEDLDIKKYAFEVAKDANKIEIKKAIEEIFGVKVVKVTTENVDGKQKRTGAYPMGKTASWKKAVVKLSADSKNIELFEGMV